MINLGIVSNFYISIDPLYSGFRARRSIVVGKRKKTGFSLLHRSSSQFSTMSFDKTDFNGRNFRGTDFCKV